MKFIAIITAKKKSYRFPNKNLKFFRGKTLLEHTIVTAKKSKYLSKVFVSTDSEKIRKIALKYKLPDLKIRSKKYAGRKASTHSVILHEIKKINYNFDYLVILQPTSPLRTTNDINNACKKILQDKKADSLVSCSKIPSEFEPKKIMTQNKKYLNFFSFQGYLINNRKFLSFSKKNLSLNLTNLEKKKEYFFRNGAIYIVKKTNIKNFIVGGKILNFVMPFDRSIDINYKEDFDLIVNTKK
jgi:CMP-N,N'-diacetyllegionaminic acid synthase